METFDIKMISNFGYLMWHPFFVKEISALSCKKRMLARQYWVLRPFGHRAPPLKIKEIEDHTARRWSSVVAGMWPTKK
jgi:hypothetical protein